MDVKVPIIWMLGGPGSGKGTQCKLIKERYHYTHLSTGDLLRAEVASGSLRGAELQEIMSKGELVSNEIVMELLKAAMNGVRDAKGFLIDGFPREETQGAAFEESIAPVDLVLYLECSDAALVDRIVNREGSRPDDNEETAKRRIKTFHENNEKVLTQYVAKLKRLKGERSIDNIFAEIVTVIDKKFVKKENA